jgi:hypothetical protein
MTGLKPLAMGTAFAAVASQTCIQSDFKSGCKRFPLMMNVPQPDLGRSLARARGRGCQTTGFKGKTHRCAQVVKIF